ncbi:MAG: ABC transporter permease [Candidatus Aureabacteria bacterium]|nr:ABC transporter permease [Candidatus Auribacterota bacterium]
MSYLIDGFREALRLILHCNPEVLGISLVSIKIATASTLIASAVGVPLGFSIASREFHGKGLVITVFNTLLALPTVVVGLMVYSVLSRQGPLGSLNLLFTPLAMIIGQFVLALPIITALSISAVQHVDTRARDTALTLGASERQAARVVLSEGRFALFAAIIAGFGRVFAEVGVSMMLGGNIRFYTRNIPTAIALETGRGEFALAIALGLILLAVAFGINILFQCLQRR